MKTVLLLPLHAHTSGRFECSSQLGVRLVLKAMSMIGRFVSQKSPSRQREAKNKEGVLTAEQQDEIVQIFKVISKGVHAATPQVKLQSFRDFEHNGDPYVNTP